MRILMVIHGYPMRFNAGSEIYTQTITRELAYRGHDIRVFTREENPFVPDYHINHEVDQSNGIQIPIILVNVARQKDRYQSDGVDQRFREVLDEFEPDIVHFQHLNHLSLGMVEVASKYGAKILFTLHDYWLACPRGQFIQINYGEHKPLVLCDGQEDQKCAEHCYSRFYRGTEDQEADVRYWTNWVSTRRRIIEDFCQNVDMFLAPSQNLKDRMQQKLNLTDNQISYLDYGFDLTRFEDRKRVNEDQIVFGFIGTHTVQKGIQHLVPAFNKLSGSAILRIWGRPRSATAYLKDLGTSIPNHLKIEWKGEYRNEDIVEKVFNHVDVIVVPSIWDENSPLVIHEALQCRIPVITADHGGMSEYVHHYENGLLFKLRSVDDLADKMQTILDDPSLIDKLGKRGYLQSSDGNIIAVEDHVDEIQRYYQGGEYRE